MARLLLSLLGPFQATLDGAPITDWPSAKVRALLAYLTVESGRPHPRETLAGLLWPDYPERSARTNLSNALSHLRTALRDRVSAGSVLTPTRQEHKGETEDTQVRAYILVDRETVQFDRESDVRVDVWEFSRLAEADPSVSGSDAAAADAAHQLEEAIGLYRGSFLEGFSLHDSPPFEQWVLVTRERLQRLVMEALARLTTLQEEQGEYEQALTTARRQLEIEPWQETAHQAAMRLLARLGRRSDALAQYEACVHILKHELAVEPAAETMRLHERIRSQDLSGAGRERSLEGPDRPVLTWVVAEERPRHNLPTQSTPFVGRERELAELGRLLADPQVRLVTIVGPGGSGKTRLALEAAARQVGHYEHGVWSVSLASLQSAEGIAPAVAGAVGFQFYPGGDPRQQLLNYLSEKRMLLVLDNWEHLLAGPEVGRGEGVGLAVDLLAAAPGVQVLATSRARLNLQGEHAFHLEGMEYPSFDLTPEEQTESVWETDSVSSYSAVQLFLQSAQRVDPKGGGFAAAQPLGSDELDGVVRLCQLVEGMPLALVLAASWVEMLTPAEIAAEVERSLDFLTAEWRDLPERQRSLRAVFDSSWRLLSEREQAVLAALSVFRGGFTREAAAQAAGADLPVLASLMNKSLITLATPAKVRPAELAGQIASDNLRRGRPVRYDMHELLRQYAQERLNGSPDGGQTVRDWHAAYYASALQRWAAELKGPRQQAASSEMDVEIANARTAWEWASEHGQVERLSQGIEGLGWFYDWRARHEEGEAVFRVTAGRLATAGDGGQTASANLQRTLARLWAWQSHLGRPLGHTEQARTLLRQSLDLLERLESAGCDVRLERAFVLWQEGMLERLSSSNSEARPTLEHSLALYRSLSARWEAASVLCVLGQTVQALGFYEQAQRMQQEALAAQRELGDQRSISGSLQQLGWLAYEQGDFEEAEGLLRESVTLARAMGAPLDVDVGLCLLYDTLEMQGRFAEAHSLAEEAQAVYFERPYHATTYPYLSEIGDIELHVGRYAEARLGAQTGLTLARKMENQAGVANNSCLLGRLAMAEGECDEAGRLTQESLNAFERLGIWSQISGALTQLAGVELLQGDVASARQHLGRALQMVIERPSFVFVLSALPFVARLLAEKGQTERALEIYALASRYPYVANSRWYKDVVGKRIAEVAATLPPEVVAAAQERGRARDVWATAEDLAAELSHPQTPRRGASTPCGSPRSSAPPPPPAPSRWSLVFAAGSAAACDSQSRRRSAAGRRSRERPGSPIDPGT